jgi:hypothetical protein
MIPFIARTWFLWWMLAIATGVRCYHLLCTRSQVQTLHPAIVEEEEAASVSSLLLQHAQIVSLPETQSAF